MKKRNKQKIFLKKCIIFLLLIVAIIFLIRNTFARYSSNASAVGTLSTAMYILEEGYQSMNLKLDTLEPRSDPYKYTFSIANNDGENRAQVNLEYDLKIVTTTNLPLTFELYMADDLSTSIVTSNVVERDEYNTYFRTLETEKKQFGFTEDESYAYTLLVYFPETYKDIKYQDVIEGIEIQVNSKQIID